MKVLIIDDDPCLARLAASMLTKENHSVRIAEHGKKAIEMLKTEHFQLIITDWMMPEVDGIAVIRYVRENVQPVPLLILATIIDSTYARVYAMEAGADAFILKPFHKDELVTTITSCINRHQQEPHPLSFSGSTALYAPQRHDLHRPSYSAVVVAASTGGPPALCNLFSKLSSSRHAAFFVVQHGPAWMLETFADKLQSLTDMPVVLGADGISISAGTVYLAPGDAHLRLSLDLKLHLSCDPPENFVRPAADPLFRDAAQVFAPKAVAVVLTGMGRDGASGASAIRQAGGLVLAQDPKSATVRGMPTAVIEAGVVQQVLEIPSLAIVLNRLVLGSGQYLDDALAS